ncbi:G-protein coupled receptor family C group 5 member B [Puntigrus tetrazona]|uniref:G-protein coupled receptor family C group 5 member B n=1 Tax=Puntigrus tetrazona TaxID=1606681 RepID=UPI001C8A7A20|nr:G-protein coupled receptor family C group 5 member B [Puntigrus tetrazona]
MELLSGGQRSNGSRPAGCGLTLPPEFWPLCDGWGIAVQTVSGAGLVSCVALMLALLGSACASGSSAVALMLFLLATAGIFSLPYCFLVALSSQTCPARVFAFSVLFSLVFGALLARGLALLGVVLVRGWREVGVVAALGLVQVIVAAEWLLVVLTRDEKTCQFSRPEFVMLQIYVMVLLAAGLATALLCLRHSCFSYSYSSSGHPRRRSKLRAALLVLTLLLSAIVWIVWVTLLVLGSRGPLWDEPVICAALTVNGWVLLLGHGFPQVLLMCERTAPARDPPLDLTGWRSPKTGADNHDFQTDTDTRRGTDLTVSGVFMREISADKDYSIPRPSTTNITYEE